MAVKIRLARRGRKKRPYYHIIVADARAPRDGKFIETIGSYNPMTTPATIELDQDKALDWMNKGAQPTDTARAILRFKGVLYKKHLMRGVAKGALTEDKANEMWQSWIDAKDAKVNERIEQAAKDRKAKWVAISGTPGAPPAPVAAEAGAAEAFTEEIPSVDLPAAEEPAAEAPVAEEVAAPAEEPAAETPVAEVADATAPETPAEAPTTEDTPAAPEAPATEAPVAEEVAAPAEEAPVKEDAPAVAEEKVEAVSEEATEAKEASEEE